MADPSEHSTPVQRQLFPDAIEVRAACLAALRDLDVPRGRRLFERARQQNPDVTDLGEIDEALALLESHLDGGPPLLAHLAQVVLAARDRFLAGGLRRAAAEFVDQVIARSWRRRGSAGPFLDEGALVHRGVLDLVLGDAEAARRHLGASLDGGLRHRADLWGYLGDACLTVERPAEANACYVRALLLSATDVDLMRIRLRRLAQLYEELCGTRPARCARDLLLVHAWLEGLLEIPPENGWLDGHVSQLEARARAGPGSRPEDRYRRFALLLYRDRSQPTGRVDMARREEMARLQSDLFVRYMHECHERERAR